MKLSKEVKVGLLTVAALAILFVGFKFLKGIDFFDPSNTYYVVYENVDGLTVSNPVSVNGFRVGRVSNIQLLQEGERTRMLVGLDINDDLVLYEGTEALLVDENPVLGGKAIVLNIRQAGSVLNEEDTLRGSVDQALGEMLKDKADPLIASVDTTLTKVNNILNDLSGSGGKVDGALGDFQATANELKYIVVENRRDINAIASNLRLLTATLNDPNSGIAPFMVKMNQLADSLNDLELQQTVARANEAMQNLQAITQNLQQGQGSLGKLMYDDSLYTNLNQSSESLNRLLMDVQENPGRYIDLRFSLIGGGGKK
ncbi:MlaD family protein [Cesiribacter sp. SM1]|uniref:MlaD family protein n=1 Tax=Cesiribacter sp. SM1 TaxID=2861196 RepID=UPI001CD22639